MPETYLTNFRLGSDAAITALMETRSGKILAGTAAGIFEWTDPREIRRKIPGIGQLAISDLAEDGSSDLWVGTTTGIYICGDGGVRRDFTTKNGLPGDWVQALLLDSRRIWATVRGGLALITRGVADDWRVEKVFSYSTGLVGEDVKALHEASDGTLWTGTQIGISRLT